MSEKPIFILGVGAPKTSTTWLYEYLCQFDTVNFGALKEYHVWDAIFSPYVPKQPWDFFKKLYGEIGNEHINIQFNMQTIPGFYEQYFKNLVVNKVRITGDITPSYCGLSAENYLDIKTKLENAGFLVKVIFLLRDPVDRCWSEFRQNNDCEQVENVEELFDYHFTHQHYQVCTQYENTLASLEQVFDKNFLYVGIYEEMHLEHNVRSLSDFCTVPYVANFVEQKINVSKKHPISETSAKTCYKFYQSTYKLMHERFPQTRQLWNKYEIH